VIIGSSGPEVHAPRTIIGLTGRLGRVLVDGRTSTRSRRGELATCGRDGLPLPGGALINWLTSGEPALLLARDAPPAGTDRPPDRPALDLVDLRALATSGPTSFGGCARRPRRPRHEPEILLYDEPTTGLDPVTAHIIDQVVVDLRNKLGVTSVVVSHDMEGVYRIADRVAMLYDGRIIATGTPHEFKNAVDPLRQTDGASRGLRTAEGDDEQETQELQ
jgi:phospholipid/cholesterol/gamma-HCH transport system ATP-binding protein